MIETKSQYKKSVKDALVKFLDKHKQRKKLQRDLQSFTKYMKQRNILETESLYNYKDEEKNRVSRATLYNTIDLLIDSELVRKHHLEIKPEYEKIFLIDSMIT